jgi:hypothetical protein
MQVAEEKTWVLKENVVHKLMMFERKSMKKMCGATRTGGGYWWIETDQEISGIMEGQNTVGVIKNKDLTDWTRRTYD